MSFYQSTRAILMDNGEEEGKQHQREMRLVTVGVSILAIASMVIGLVVLALGLVILSEEGGVISYLSGCNLTFGVAMFLAGLFEIVCACTRRATGCMICMYDMFAVTSIIAAIVDIDTMRRWLQYHDGSQVPLSEAIEYTCLLLAAIGFCLTSGSCVLMCRISQEQERLLFEDTYGMGTDK
ncbi:Hypp2507 [Branchiostoma lanceolatum]|uniref:Transmembrane protein 196 n=1 Tax=Branchiostoma lanceolatum TaxID=7740 RepID=A0A8K0ETF9_BRALA|nr:Hypp2507 [Branchiostoma lanceolatum]